MPHHNHSNPFKNQIQFLSNLSPHHDRNPRAFHTTTITSARGKTTKKQKKQPSQRDQEAQRLREFKQQLQKLKDTKFLNSLIKPQALFENTQISQFNTAAASLNEPTDNSAATNSSQKGTSNQYHSFITSEEVDLVCNVAPKAAVDLDKGHNRLVSSQQQIKQAECQGEIVKKIVSLENADAKAATHLNIKKAVETFARDSKDTGSPEVQGK